MITRFHRTASPINEWVESIIYFQGYVPDHETERVVPDGYMHLILELDGMERSVYDKSGTKVLRKLKSFWFAGLQRDYIIISTHRNSEMIVARFHAHGAFALLGSSLPTSGDRFVDSKSLHSLGLDKIRQQLTDCDDIEKKILFLEGFLEKCLSNSHNIPDVILAAAVFIRDNATAQLKELVEQAPYSKKQFIYLFKKHIGVTPKLYQRIVRFNELLQKIDNEEMISWTQVSLDCGYYDQAHFIKDFKSFSGLNPSQFLAIHKDTDRINFFPLD